MDEWITPTQAAIILGVTRQAVLHHIKAGRLPAQRLGERSWMLQRADVDAFTPPASGWPKGRPRKAPEGAGDAP